MCNIIRLVFDIFFLEIPYLCDETHRENEIIATFLIEKNYIFHPFLLYRLKEKKILLTFRGILTNNNDENRCMDGLIETFEIITKLIRFIKIMKI